MAYVYAWANGLIEFGKTVPDGAIEIAKGNKKHLQDTVYGTARLAYDNKTWLVPGIPEAETEREALDALSRYNKMFQKNLKAKL